MITKAMNPVDRMKVIRFPCDGVKRYRMREVKGVVLTYAEAWNTIFDLTDCTEEPIEGSDGKRRTYTREGIQRLGVLNDNYQNTARDFILADLEKRKQVVAEKAKAIDQAVETSK